MNYHKGIAILNQIACEELQPKQPKRINHVRRIKSLARRKGISLQEAYSIYQIETARKGKE